MFARVVEGGAVGLLIVSGLWAIAGIAVGNNTITLAAGVCFSVAVIVAFALSEAR